MYIHNKDTPEVYTYKDKLMYTYTTNQLIMAGPMQWSNLADLHEKYFSYK